MAKNKSGFLYYSVETDRYQDKKIKRLKREKGPTGLAIYDYVLCEIYRVEGCYLKWDEEAILNVADYWGMDEEVVNDIIIYCSQIGLFNKVLLASKGLLSGLSIQSRFIDWSKKAKRNNVKIPEECIILPEEEEIILEESDKTPEERNKVKESKVKESKIDTIVSIGTEVPPEDNVLQNEYASLPKSIENIFQFLKTKPMFPEPYMDYWNLFAKKYSFPTISKLNDKRKKKLKVRLADKDFVFTKILFKAKSSDIINSGSWFSFDWIIENEGNYLKVLEGNYDNKQPVLKNETDPDYEKHRRELEERTKQLASE